MNYERPLKQGEIKALDMIGDKYGVTLCLPPFLNSEHCFYDIEKISQDGLAFREFLMEVKEVGVAHRFMPIDGGIYLEMYVEEEMTEEDREDEDDVVEA